MMNKETLNRACLEKAFLDYLRTVHDEQSRAGLRDQLDAGDRITSDLGTAYVTQPRPRWTVADEQALFDWVEGNFPDEIVVERKVNPALRAAILKNGGVVVDGVTHRVDGVEQTTGKPTLTVKPSERAHESAPLLLQGILEPPAVEGFPEVEAS